MSWQRELDELRARERMAREMGGADKVQRQHDGGRLTIRERIDGLIDPDTFHEVGAIAGKAEYDEANELKKLTPSNCVMGRAKVDGRPVIVLGDDFTVRGGAADAPRLPPDLDAVISTVSPPGIVALASAPAFRSRSTTAALPLSAASDSGITPYRLRAFTSAPAESSAFTSARLS